MTGGVTAGNADVWGGTELFTFGGVLLLAAPAVSPEVGVESAGNKPIPSLEPAGSMPDASECALCTNAVCPGMSLVVGGTAAPGVGSVPWACCSVGPVPLTAGTGSVPPHSSRQGYGTCAQEKSRSPASKSRAKASQSQRFQSLAGSVGGCVVGEGADVDQAYLPLEP